MTIETQEEIHDCQAWLKEHRDRIIADAKAGMRSAQIVIDVHRMLVARADEPTWGMMLAVWDDYKRTVEEYR